MNIKKLKDGKTVCEVSDNQVIYYTPETDSYTIETDILLDQLHITTIRSDVLDRLYNLAWEDNDEEVTP